MKLVLAGVLLGTLVACGNDSKPAPSSGNAAARLDASAAPAAQAMPRLYLIAGGNKLAVGDAGGYRRLGADGDQYFSIVPRPDGSAWIGGTPGLQSYDGATLATIETPGLDKVSPMAITPDGALWAIAGDRIARRDAASGAWASWTLAQAGASATGRLLRLHVGTDGTAYVPAGTELLIGDGQAWRKATAQGGMVIASVAVDGDGRVYASVAPAVRTAKSKGAFFELRDGALVHVADSSYAGAELELQTDGSVLASSADVILRAGAAAPVGARTWALGPDGTRWTTDPEMTAVIANALDGTTTRYPAKGKFEGRVSGIELERGGRAWILLDSGLAVVDGGALKLLPPGTLAGVPGEVRRIVLAGDTIALPPFPEPKRITLRGRFVGPDQAPRKGVKVELCRDLSLTYSGKTPCAGKQPAWRATSAADGTFELADLPAGGWSIAFSTTGKDWAIRTKYAWKADGDLHRLDDFVLGE